MWRYRRLDRHSGSSTDAVIQRGKCFRGREQDISSILGLHDAPVIDRLNIIENGTEILGALIEETVELLDVE
jgi:hypothetical protein